MKQASLDDAVARCLAALERRRFSRPGALYLLSTGVEVLAGRLRDASRLPLGKLEAAPESWSEVMLHQGTLEGLPVWLVENSRADAAESEPAWAAAFPIWLAAAAGASSFVSTHAGSSLDEKLAPVGALALVRDHVNLSGSTPLVGLSASRLGAQFPDQSRVHDPMLRAAARELCKKLGLEGRESVAACSLGPTLETPAERRWFKAAGADVSAQELAPGLIAAAHAGLGGLAIVVVVHAADEALDIARIAARSERLAPAIDELLTALARDVQRTARARLDEVGG
jgi:purine-nucleoside phosphorylase